MPYQIPITDLYENPPVNQTSNPSVPPTGGGGLIDPVRSTSVDPGPSSAFPSPDGYWVDSASDNAGTSKVGPDRLGPTVEGPDVRVQLTDQLIGKGIDPTRAQTIADMLLKNAATQPSVDSVGFNPASVGSAGTAQAADPGQIGPISLQDLLGMGSGIGIGDTSVHTRDVLPEELIQYQLEGLLSGDSSYIRNARLRGLEQANQRGQFNSSWAAGSAERAAMEAALPIATGDAQAFRDMATQNLNALNNYSLANLQRATALDSAILDANTNISIANLDAATRVSLANLDAITKTNIANLDAATQTRIANMQADLQANIAKMQANLQLTLQSRELTHQTGLEQLQQAGRVELTMLDGEIRERLQHLANQGQIDLANLNQEQRIELESILQDYRLETQAKDHALQREANRSELYARALANNTNYVASFANVDMDKAAAERLRVEAQQRLDAEISLINKLFPDFPPLSARSG